MPRPNEAAGGGTGGLAPLTGPGQRPGKQAREKHPEGAPIVPWRLATNIQRS